MAKAKEIYESLADTKGNKTGSMEVLVKKLNVLLQNKSPEKLCLALEHFVALLRNSKVATNVDVELFFMDAKKLTTKLRRMDPSTLKYDNVLAHRDQLASMSNEKWFDEKP